MLTAWKCDEAKPSGSGCADRRASCRYSTEASRFIQVNKPAPEGESSRTLSPRSTTAASQPRSSRMVLSIRSSRQSPSGNGLCHTFVPLKMNPKGKSQSTSQFQFTYIRAAPMNDSARLAQRFNACLYSVSSVGLSMRLLGTWMERCTVSDWLTYLKRPCGCLHCVRIRSSSPQGQ